MKIIPLCGALIIALVLGFSSSANAQAGIESGWSKSWFSVGEENVDDDLIMTSAFFDVAKDTASTWGVTIGASFSTPNPGESANDALVVGLSVGLFSKQWGDKLRIAGGVRGEFWETPLFGEFTTAVGGIGSIAVKTLSEIELELSYSWVTAVSGVDDIDHSGVFFGPRVKLP